jgi:hypothetical protein
MNSIPLTSTEPYDPLIQKDKRPKRKRKDKKDDTNNVGGITIEKRPIVFNFD